MSREPPRTRRRGRALLGAALAVGALAMGACSRSGEVKPDHVLGDSGRATTVLVDSRIAPLVTPALAAFAARSGQVGYGTGAPEDIAATVKDGLTADAVVVPSGHSLDVLRPEFVFPARPLGAVHGATYWIGAVDTRGWALTTFLTGRAGRRSLVAHGVQPPPP